MNKPELIPSEPLPLSGTKSAGQVLSAARKKWDLSVEDIARSLNLGVDTIKALEQDAYDQLPGSTFVKGYIRAYAKLLNLNQEEIVRSVNLQPERPSEIPATRAALKRKGQLYVRQKKNGGLFSKLILILVVLAGLVWFATNQLPDLDMKKISAILKLHAPASTDQGESGDEITFPLENDSSGSNKGALIRIE